MKPLLIAESDIAGGAARSTYRLHQSLRTIGVNSQVLVRSKLSVDAAVIKYETPQTKLGPSLNGLPLNFYPKRDRSIMFSPQWFPDPIAPKVAQISPDVISLHWVCNGYLQIETLAKFNKPIVWTIHDMWAFTGGCHYNQECDRYTDSCGACPQLGSSNNQDLSRLVWQRKAKAWKNLNLTIVSPSSWLAKCAQASSLFGQLRVEVIPYGLDTSMYQPIDRQVARKILGLPTDKQLVLCATSDHRKGFHLLCPAIQSLSKSGWQDKIELVIFGPSQPDSQTDVGVKLHYLGKFSDDISLQLIYAAADVFIAPSIQDNLPNTVMEAIACGTPCVAFNIGGMPDMIEHQQNGYLAEPYRVDDLAQGIAWVLENPERHQKLCFRAREKTEKEFTLEDQGYRYLSLFNEILAGCEKT